MPSKKKVSARRASSGKRVSLRISGASSRSGRPQRKSALGTDYKLIGSRAVNDVSQKQANELGASSAPKAEPPKKRGRPAKSVAISATKTTTNTTSATRASPRKTATPVKAGRGRPKAADTRAKATAEPAPAPASTPTAGKRKRVDEESTSQPPAKRRGRPPKSRETDPKPQSKAAVKAEKTKITAAATPSVAPKKRGRPAGSLNKVSALKKSTNTSEKATKSKILAGNGIDADADVLDGDDDSDEQYWLMKAEPDTRIENGTDVSFPIDKLAAATEPEPWDGVRNHVARNNMRAMRKGDLAFFYHSNCKVPGIVGVMRVVAEHSIDESAFDANHPYFDAKSNRDNPKWDCVKVEFVKKFLDIISLKKVQATPELARMQLATGSYSRLSVQKVSPGQWKHILKMAGEPDDLGVPSKASGYEADTNEESDKEAVEESVIGDATPAANADADIDAQKLAAYGSIDEPMDDNILTDQQVPPVANGVTV